MPRILCVLLLMLLSPFSIAAELPDPFVFTDGRRVKTAADWAARRAELQELILRHEYGQWPLATAPLKHDGRLAVIEEGENVYFDAADKVVGHGRAALLDLKPRVERSVLR